MLRTDDNSEDSFVSNYSDIESCRLSSASVSTMDINNNILTSILQPSHENNVQTQEILEYCVNVATIYTILLINVPLVVLDIYYALKNHNCIYKHNSQILNLFIYLLVSGINCGVETIVMISLTYLDMYKLIKLTTSTVYINLIIRTIIGLSWIIVGSIVFWNTIEYEHKCNNEVYKYVFVQLIIKSVVVVFNSKGLLGYPNVPNYV